MIAEIKTRFTIPSLAAELYPDWRPAKSCLSPFRPDRTPSFSVFDEGRRFRDFATGDCGDVLDFYARAKGISPEEALVELWDRLGAGNVPPSAVHATSPKERIGPSSENPLALPHQLTKPEQTQARILAENLLSDPSLIDAIAATRGWKPDTIRGLALEGELGLTAEGVLVFIYATGWKFRWKDDAGKRQIKWAPGARKWFWRGALLAAAGEIYLTEGETDTINLLDEGLEVEGRKVVALPDAGFTNIEPWLFLFSGKTVIFFADPDEPGQQCAGRIQTLLEEVTTQFSIIT